jgi:uncharacterized protein YggE
MNRQSTRILVLTAVSFLSISAVSLAQEKTDSMSRPTIRVSGDATVTVKPDEAEINIGVLTQADTAQAAATQNAQKQDAVISELKKMLGASADIKTIGYSVSPNYRYPKEGGQPTISGYTASNIVQVKTMNLAQVGKLIDLATQSGANNIQSLRFVLKDDSVARAQALREASTKARAKAETIASALGLKIQKVLRVEEGGSTIRPAFEMGSGDGMALRAQAAPTPIETGSIEVRAMITLTVEVVP